MPGDRKHHTEKFRRCVEEVMGKGHDEDSAYAICTTSLQKAGEAIYENAEMHALHLLGATGTVHTEMINGREHLVVPVVALMEGVIHAVNAETPEFVPWSTIERIAESFNGRPVTLGHPAKNGKQCSASLPGILDVHGIGTIRNAKAVKESKKLLMEALIDKTKSKQLHPEMYQRLLDGKTEEVSVGAFIVTDEVAGDYHGKPFKAQWLAGSGDHLAFLPGGRGACSVAMGCGTHRAAMHFVTAEGIVALPEITPVLAFTVLEEKSLEDRMRAIQTAVNQRWAPSPPTVAASAPWPYVMQTFDDRLILQLNDEIFSVDYDVTKEGVVALGEAKRVKQAWVAAEKKQKLQECPNCKGLGNTGSNPCEMCDGEGEIRAAALVSLLGLRPCSDSAKDIYGQAMKILGDRPGHAFHGNQHTEPKGPEEIAAEKARQEVQAFFSPDRVKQENGHFVLYGTDGYRLGQYNTQAEAEAHGKAIDRVLSKSK